LLVIDDDSTDKTINVVSGMSTADSRIIIVQNNKNQGVASTRNRGLELARGKYIAFLDSDDIWMPFKLEKQLELMERTKTDLCYTSYEFIDNRGTQVGKHYYVPELVNYRGLLRENVIGLSTVLLRHSSLEAMRFDDRWFHEDYVMWLELLRNGKTAMGLPEVMVHYRTGGRSANKLKAAENRWLIYRKAENLKVLTSTYYMLRYFLAALKKYQWL
jgi:teichuronic acid biosynthesis glycosyltransferase TuaG